MKKETPHTHVQTQQQQQQQQQHRRRSSVEIRQEILDLQRQAALEAGDARSATTSPSSASSFLDLSTSTTSDKQIEVSLSYPKHGGENEEDNEAPSGSTTSRSYSTAAKLLAVVVGVGILTGLAVGILTMVDFMKTNGIQLKPSSSSASSRLVSLVEVAQHNTPQDDCWVVYHSQVYDMSVYAKRRHPAGAAWIDPWCGQDGTDAYSQFHSESLLRSIQGDIVGTIGTLQDEQQQQQQQQDGSPPTAGGSSTTISLSELSSHTTKGSDCWAAYHGNVYDISDYKHPGGNRWIQCGLDDTRSFAGDHRERLLSSISNLLLGPLEGGGGGSSTVNTGGGGNGSDSGD
jgi:cytochrome b involved in lipid metabolism